MIHMWLSGCVIIVYDTIIIVNTLMLSPLSAWQLNVDKGDNDTHMVRR